MPDDSGALLPRAEVIAPQRQEAPMAGGTGELLPHLVAIAPHG
jgi:hypothetical protein